MFQNFFSNTPIINKTTKPPTPTHTPVLHTLPCQRLKVYDQILGSLINLSSLFPFLLLLPLFLSFLSLSLAAFCKIMIFTENTITNKI